MLRTPRSRALALVVLLGALFGLCVWFGALAPAPEAWALPDAEHLGSDYDAYVGERTQVGGIVVATDPPTIDAGDRPDRELRLRVTGVPLADVAAGDTLRVYGTVRPDRTIRATNAIVVPAWGRWYTWSISFLAGLWVLGRLVGHWRVEARGLAPREGPLGPLSWARERIGRGVEDA